ncbi:DUF3732 domain-containing protein [Mycolicibacterium aichiense]|uniref:DUF3732 domain-containing protein n=1 Tax=Mycolicibacterium aichiense TaxID=1799 RepID=UPI003D67E8A6
MQILEVVLYQTNGKRRTVRFATGALNVVTGISATGKSALLHIIEYCLGRDQPTIPAGVITDSVDWYAVLLQLPSTRAFVARPRLGAGAVSTTRAMLELGADLESLEVTALEVNTDTRAVREQLGKLVGIDEYRHQPPAGSLRHPLEAGLGQAALLCFQGQGEVANQNILFHRQNEEGVSQALKDTLPYFLGAVASDQAIRRLELANARRDLRRAEEDLANARRYAEAIDSQVQALLEEAYSSGLIDTREAPSRDEAIRLLRAAVDRPKNSSVHGDDLAGRRRELEGRRLPLRQELRDISDERAILWDQVGSEEGYEDAVESQISRLRSIELVPTSRKIPPAEDCPICGSTLVEPDATVRQLGNALDRLRTQLDGVRSARPRREAALRSLNDRADAARQQLRAIDAALADLAAGDRLAVSMSADAEEQAFRRGRIDALLTRLRPAGATVTDKELAVRQAQLLVDELADLVDPDAEREEIISRLNIIGSDMTRWANELQLEHAARSIRLDLNRLTVVADTEHGPVPLNRVGSAENWVGYHLVAHLALHRYFVKQSRPVPRFLMLDQPTQAYFPSEREQESGKFEAEDDLQAVRRLFLLMRDVVEELQPNFQVIVADHANLDEDWFQKAVDDNNFRGVKLIPDSWLLADDPDEETGDDGD